MRRTTEPLSLLKVLSCVFDQVCVYICHLMDTSCSVVIVIWLQNTDNFKSNIKLIFSAQEKGVQTKSSKIRKSPYAV